MCAADLARHLVVAQKADVLTDPAGRGPRRAQSLLPEIYSGTSDSVADTSIFIPGNFNGCGLGRSEAVRATLSSIFVKTVLSLDSIMEGSVTASKFYVSLGLAGREVEEGEVGGSASACAQARDLGALIVQQSARETAQGRALSLARYALSVFPPGSARHFHDFLLSVCLGLLPAPEYNVDKKHSSVNSECGFIRVLPILKSQISSKYHLALTMRLRTNPSGRLGRSSPVKIRKISILIPHWVKGVENRRHAATDS
ncbi:hypothetical protein J6590_021608 [Homalodisca vitripennis]|nr:hypothetical protein J6590_021608 [Homalodisca vitripennis]